jgi:hypothetical protein
VRRRSGLNFSRRRKKLNVPLFKEILSWVIECAVVVLIAYTCDVLWNADERGRYGDEGYAR